MHIKIKNIAANVKVGAGLVFAVAGIIAIALVISHDTPASAAVPANFVYRSGNKLMLNGAPYQFVGYNAFGITGCEGSAWTRTQLDAHFASLPPASMTRFWATQKYGTGTLDQVVASAEAHNQKVVMTLNNDLADCVSDGAKNSAWYQSGYKSSYLTWVKQVAIKYKDSPAIGMWEVINEAGQSQGEGSLDGTVMKNFYQDVAVAIKAIDPNHLVSTGDNAEFNYAGGASAYKTAGSAAAIDVLSLHDYETDYGGTTVISTHFSTVKSAADSLGKPLYIGEMNDRACSLAKTTRAANVKQSIDSYITGGAAGVLVWNRSQTYYNSCSGQYPEDYIIVPSDPLYGIIQNYKIAGVVTTPPSTPAPTGCTVPTNYGSVTKSITVPSTGTYKIWSRINVSDTASNSYSLDVDGMSCTVVGDNTSIPVNTWTWVGYKNGSTSSAITMNLSAGTHTFKLIGREAGVKIDRLLALSDQACTPTGTGNNCTANTDATVPVVTITSPVSGASVRNTVSITATATDNIGISKVEFLVDNIVKSTVLAGPFSHSWNTAGFSNGAHTISIKAYDAAGNVGAASSSVTVSNGDAQAPTTPTGVKAVANSVSQVAVSWAASTDNVGVAGYTVTRNGTVLAMVTNGGTAYADNTVAPNTQYSYQIIAYDAAGNKSATSAAAVVKTPQPVAQDTQAPSTPVGLLATAVSTSQINLTWAKSTDNIAVAGYDVYRAALSAPAAKVATVSGTSFGDSGLRSDSLYTYYVVAKDAAGNQSGQSASTSAITQKIVVGTGSLRGVVTSADRGRVLSGVTVVLWSSDGKQYTTTTNILGVYRFDNLNPAYYAATFYMSGYRDQQIYFEIKAGQNTVKNVQLSNWAKRPWWRLWW